jgi:hypothetical protein
VWQQLPSAGAVLENVTSPDSVNANNFDLRSSLTQVDRYHLLFVSAVDGGGEVCALRSALNLLGQREAGLTCERSLPFRVVVELRPLHSVLTRGQQVVGHCQVVENQAAVLHRKAVQRQHLRKIDLSDFVAGRDVRPGK